MNGALASYCARSMEIKIQLSQFAAIRMTAAL
jgi:hypothetical protein